MPDDNRTAIKTNAEDGIAEASGDGFRARQHSLKDQIEADAYLSGAVAATRKHRGLRFTKLIPPGAST